MSESTPPTNLRRLLEVLPLSFRDRYRGTFHGLRERFYRLRRKVAPPRVPTPPEGKFYVNLGCGELDNPHFINVDTSAWKHVHYVHSVDSLPMFASNTVDMIYCSHCLEHVPHHESARVLKEWHRVLKPGGGLKLAVPDIDAVIRFYQENPDKFEEAQWYFMGAQTYPANFHYAIFNRARLTRLMEDAGFVGIRPWTHDEAPELMIDDCSRTMLQSRNGPIALSLNLFGVKAATAAG